MQDDVLMTTMSVDQAKKWTDSEGRITFRFAIDLCQLACISDDGSIEGLNCFVDNLVPTGVILADINYRPVGVDGDLIIIECDADAEGIDTAEEDND